MAHKRDIPHPACDAPSAETVLWRYLGIKQFLGILDSQHLSLRRLDLYGEMDRFEGSVPISAHNWMLQLSIRHLTQRDAEVGIVSTRKAAPACNRSRTRNPTRNATRELRKLLDDGV